MQRSQPTQPALAPNVEVYHSRVKSIHNPPPYPIQEMYLVRHGEKAPCLHVVFLGDPALQQNELRQLLREVRPQLEKIGVEVCCGSRESVAMYTPAQIDGIMVCIMTCNDPTTYKSPTAVAHLMKKVGARFRIPGIPFPQLLDSLPRYSPLLLTS